MRLGTGGRVAPSLILAGCITFKMSVLMDAGYRDMDSAIKEHIGTVQKAGPRAINADQKRDRWARSCVSKRADRGHTCWEPS